MVEINDEQSRIDIDIAAWPLLLDEMKCRQKNYKNIFFRFIFLQFLLYLAANLLFEKFYFDVSFPLIFLIGPCYLVLQAALTLLACWWTAGEYLRYRAVSELLCEKQAAAQAWRPYEASAFYRANKDFFFFKNDGKRFFFANHSRALCWIYFCVSIVLTLLFVILLPWD